VTRIPLKIRVESNDPFLSQAHAEIHTPTQKNTPPCPGPKAEARQRLLIAGMQLLPLPNCQRTANPAVSRSQRDLCDDCKPIVQRLNPVTEPRGISAKRFAASHLLRIT
jgi:hypothetical protein